MQGGAYIILSILFLSNSQVRNIRIFVRITSVNHKSDSCVYEGEGGLKFYYGQ